MAIMSNSSGIMSKRQAFSYLNPKAQVLFLTGMATPFRIVDKHGKSVGWGMIPNRWHPLIWVLVVFGFCWSWFRNLYTVRVWIGSWQTVVGTKQGREQAEKTSFWTVTKK